MINEQQQNDISNERKKKFIVENSRILSRDIKLTILSLVMMEVDQSVIMECITKHGVDIDLDLLEIRNVEVLNHIYNIVRKRLDILKQPAKNTIINDIC